MLSYIFNLAKTISVMGEEYGLFPNGSADFSYTQLAQNMLIFCSIFAIVVFITKSVAIYLMCKNNNIPNCYLAFIPFANYYLIGKLTGRVRVFSWNIKNIGLITGILLFAMFALSTFVDIFVYFDEFRVLLLQNKIVEVTYANTAIFTFIRVLSEIIFYVTLFFVVMTNFALISKYKRNSAIWVSIVLTLLFGQLFYLVYNFALAIVILVIRKNKPLFTRVTTQRDSQQENYSQNASTTTSSSRPVKEEDPFEKYSSNKNTSTLNQDIFADFSPSSDYTKENENKDN